MSSEPDMATDFSTRTLRHSQSFCDFRRIGPRARGGRRKRISGFKYDVIDRLYGDVIFVVAIAHHRRRAFWLRRRRIR